MPTERESFLKGIRSYCERHASQYDAALLQKVAEAGVLYSLDPAAFRRGIEKAAQNAPPVQKSLEERKRELEEKMDRIGDFFTWKRLKPWVIGGAVSLGALGLGLGLGSRYGRHAERTGNPYGPIKGSLFDFGEWLTGKYYRYHPEWSKNPPVGG